VTYYDYAFQIIIIIDACQEDEEEEDEEESSENFPIPPPNNLATSSQPQTAHLLITSSKGQLAWGANFINPLVAQLNGNETDVWKILRAASDEAQNLSVSKNHEDSTQTVQFPPSLEEGDITLPPPIAHTQN